MINKGTTFQPRFAIGSNEPTVAFLDGKIVYSKYVVFGTTYNTADFTFSTTINNVEYSWQCEVFSKAGTDEDGDYYYFGLVNDTQGLATTPELQSVISAMLGYTYQTSVKCRDMLWMIPFGDINNYSVYYIGCQGNTRIKSFDFSFIPEINLTTLARAFEGSGLISLTALGRFLQKQQANTLLLTRMCYNAANISTLTLTGFTHWSIVTSLYEFASNCTQLHSIELSEADNYNPNFIPVSVRNCPNLEVFPFDKMKINKLAGFSLGGDTSLTRVSGTAGCRIKMYADLNYLFNDCWALEDSPQIETWTGEINGSKPTVCVAYPLTDKCGRDIPQADRDWFFDFTGWSFYPQYAAQQELGKNGYFPPILNSVGYAVKFDGIKLLPYSGNGYVLVHLFSLFQGQTADVCKTSTFDLDGMVDSSLSIYVGASMYYHTFEDCTALTTVRLGRAQPYCDGKISEYSLTNVFKNAVNISSIDLRVRHFNIYRRSFDSVSQSYKTDLNTFFISQATAWTDATQLGDLIDDMATIQSEQYRVNGIPLNIQFNAAQEAVIKALPNWSTKEIQIAGNGWNLIWPVSVNDVPTNINMAELDAI